MRGKVWGWISPFVRSTAAAPDIPGTQVPFFLQLWGFSPFIFLGTAGRSFPCVGIPTSRVFPWFLTFKSLRTDSDLLNSADFGSF